MKNSSNLNSDSPCANKCKLENNICIGRGLYLEEIRDWYKMTDAEKHQINTRLKKNNESKKNQNPKRNLLCKPRKI